MMITREQAMAAANLVRRSLKTLLTEGPVEDLERYPIATLTLERWALQELHPDDGEPITYELLASLVIHPTAEHGEPCVFYGTVNGIEVEWWKGKGLYIMAATGDAVLFHNCVTRGQLRRLIAALEGK